VGVARFVQRWRRTCRDVPGVVALVVLLAATSAATFAPWLTPHDPVRMNIPLRLKEPGFAHPFGTDRFGRDALARVIFGLRITLGVSVLSVGLGLAAGGGLGALSSYFTRLWGWTVRLQEVLLSFPPILLAIVIVATLEQALGTLVLAVSFIQVPYFAIMTHNLVRSQLVLEYVQAGVALGGRDAHILARHVLPSVLPALLVYLTVRLSSAILSVSYLSFLGLGPPPPTPELGLIIAEGRQHLFSHPYLVAYPAAVLVPLVLSVNLAGDSLRDLLEGEARRPRGGRADGGDVHDGSRDTSDRRS
jgi:peptide/nickel transport system permease protein